MRKLSVQKLQQLQEEARARNENLPLSQLEKILLPDNKPKSTRGRKKGIKNKNGYKKRVTCKFLPDSNTDEILPPSIKENTQVTDAQKLLAFVKANCMRDKSTPKSSVKKVNSPNEPIKPFVRPKAEYSNEKNIMEIISDTSVLKQTPRKW